MNAPSKPFFLQALDALKSGDRRGAAVLLGRQLRDGETSPKNLPSVSQLAAHIGEIDLAIDAMRRAVVPGSIESLIAYWATLATYGRSEEAMEDVQRHPRSIREHPSALHFRGTSATEFGRFDEAQELFRRALAEAPAMAATWLSLAMIKRFRQDDPDIAAMEEIERHAGGEARTRAPLYYALGKAREDCGDTRRAFDDYSKGAELLRQQVSFDTRTLGAVADQVIRDFTPDNLKQLAPSTAAPQRSLFVTGLPRSGTTLTEQILRGHSEVTAGGEVNLFPSALIPLMGFGFGNALAYQQRSRQSDCWGEIGRDYARFIDMRFPAAGRVVDKSLGQSMLIGLMLHALPDARIAWLRRSPDDVALSCFRTFFSIGLPWTCSLADIADAMRVEDRLFAHWRSIFPERILVVQYEELVGAPDLWADKLQQHFGLPPEAGIANVSREGRAIGSASVSQAREPVSTARVGASAPFEKELKPFRDRYYA